MSVDVSINEIRNLFGKDCFSIEEIKELIEISKNQPERVKQFIKNSKQYIVQNNNNTNNTSIYNNNLNNAAVVSIIDNNTVTVSNNQLIDGSETNNTVYV